MRASVAQAKARFSEMIEAARGGLIVGGELPLDALFGRLQLAGQYNDEHALAPVQCDSLRTM